MSRMERFVPAARWLGRYERRFMARDLAAGLAVGFWETEDDIRTNWAESKRWEPQMDEATRAKLYAKWKKAVTKTFDWVDDDD